jgi:pyruvate formate lyase activating enzyme
MRIDKEKCIKCGGCVSVCPLGALELKDELIVDKEKCQKCGICEKFCPVGAIKVKGD